MTAQEQSRFMRERHGIAWWWRDIGSDGWSRQTHGMSREQFVADYQESALRYEWQARHTRKGEPRKGKLQFGFGVPWIDLTHEQRERLREQSDLTHGVIETGKDFHGKPNGKPDERDALALVQLLPGTVVTANSTGTWLAPVSLNLAMPTETLLRVLREQIEAERGRRGITITRKPKGGRPADPWRAFEIADVLRLPVDARPFPIGDSERSQLSKFSNRMAESSPRV
jgi:hypothetical protein